MWQYSTPEELYHWGILGMKWGHRKAKYQNNKKITLAGKKKKYYSKDSREAYRLSKKKLYEMSNQEIKTLNTRRELESNYKRLNKGNIGKVMAVVGGVAAALGTYNTLRGGFTNIKKDGRAIAQKYKNLRVKVK